jgi:hypothetical protein
MKMNTKRVLLSVYEIKLLVRIIDNYISRNTESKKDIEKLKNLKEKLSN